MEQMILEILQARIGEVTVFKSGSEIIATAMVNGDPVIAIAEVGAAPNEHLRSRELADELEDLLTPH